MLQPLCKPSGATTSEHLAFWALPGRIVSDAPLSCSRNNHQRFMLSDIALLGCILT